MVKTVSHKNEMPYFGEEPLLEIAGKRSFASMIFELLSGKKPKEAELKLFEMILNISIDHGADTPSAVEVIKAGRKGKTISEAVSLGILQINDSHGGAIEPAMELFYKIKNEKLNVKDLVGDHLNQGKRIAGFGHRIYEVDPRSQLIFKMAKEEGISQGYIEIALEIDKELSLKKDRPIPVNIDGAIAAILCGFGWNSNLGKAVFIIARTPGLCGQFLTNWQ